MRKNILPIFFLAIMLVAFSFDTARAQSCKYETSGEVEITTTGNMLIELRSMKVRKIQGKVFDPVKDPAVSAIVTVYRLNKESKDYVGHQTVDSKGKYCFGDLPAGEYFLKVQAPGFNITTINIYLLPDNINVLNRKIKDLYLQLGV